MKQQSKVLLWAIIFLILLNFISGCWDSNEAEDLAVISLMSFDLIKTDNGTDQWQVSARVMFPGGKEEQDSQSSSKGASSEILMKGTGITLQDAVINFMGRLPRKIFYEQGDVKIIGERVAKEKMKEYTEAALRFPEIRPHSFFLVTKGEAFKVLQAEPKVTLTLYQEIRRFAVKYAKLSGTSYGVTMTEFSEWILSQDRDAVLPQIKLLYPQEGEKTVPKSIIVEGLAIFRDGKLVGWLNKDETKGYLFLAQKINKAQIAIPVSKDEKNFTYWLTNSTSRIEATLTGDRPSILIKVNTLGMVSENDGIDLSPEQIKSLEGLASEKIQEFALETVNKAKDNDSDFLGLMQKMHRFNPRAWGEVASNWRERFREANVDVEVEAKIVSVGKMSQSLE